MKKETDVEVKFVIDEEEVSIYVDSGVFYNLAMEALQKGISVQDLMIEKYGSEE